MQERLVEGKFPKGFLFGAATAGHQVGDNVNGGSDWNSFEEANADRLAAEAGPEKDYGNGPLPEEIWNRISAQAKNPRNYISSEASGWWSGHWQDDLDRARDIGLKAVRFSIERARVQPRYHLELDQSSLTHYKRLIQGCKERGMQPIVTLFHFVNPTWLAEAGGWENSDTPQDFADYSKRLVREIAEDVEIVLTMNEPEVYVLQGWLFGEWPPQKQFDIGAARRVRRNLVEAHKRGFDAIKEVDDSIQVSAAVNLSHVEPKTGGPRNRLGAKLSRKLSNGMFLPKMVDHMDFVGINHYMHNVKKGLDPRNSNFQNEGEPRSDLGWYVNPESLYKVIMDTTKKYRKPIIVTEHGVADSEDRIRPQFIRDSLAEVLRARQDGADVLGYLHWALVDNFEWHEGFWPRFGLIEVDYETQARLIRPSAYEYKSIIRANKV